MLNIIAAARAALVARTHGMVTSILAAQARHRQRAILTRLLDEDEARLRDIGLTAQDVIEMLRHDAPARRATGTAAANLIRA